MLSYFFFVSLCEESIPEVLPLTFDTPCILTLSVKVKDTLRLTVGQSVSLGVKPHLGPMARYLLLVDSYGFVFLERPLWRENGPVFCMCCWPIFYCLRFETSLFVTSYDSQGHGGGIRPRLHQLSVNYSFSLYNPARIAQKTSPIIACFVVAGETCPQRCPLATAVVLSPVFTPVTCQWICTSQQFLFHCQDRAVLRVAYIRSNMLMPGCNCNCFPSAQLLYRYTMR
jgi:hypothetical protein